MVCWSGGDWVGVMVNYERHTNRFGNSSEMH